MNADHNPQLLKETCSILDARRPPGKVKIQRRNGETVYHCKNGCQPIVVFGTPGDSQWPSRGYRMGEHVIHK
jgi:hypothetical protein